MKNMKQCSRCLREYNEEKTFCPYDGTKLTVSVKIDRFLTTTIDQKYKINYKIAEGGMGNVYHATHLQLNVPVAIKIMHPDLVSDDSATERFRREALAAMKIRHNNAITVMDFGTLPDKVVYIVMEYLEGCTLRQRLKEVGFLHVFDAHKIMQQVCAAVSAAHKRKIIHRDLKPDNIFLMEDEGEECVKVLDFGIAKMKYQGGKVITKQGIVVGTPHYMSPEQCYGREVDTRTDIYSLGVILYEMLTGVVPFDADTPLALALKQAEEEPIPVYQHRPEIPEAINAVVMHAMAKEPEDRPQNVFTFAKELEEAIRDNIDIIPSMGLISTKNIQAELLDDIDVKTPFVTSEPEKERSKRRNTSGKNRAVTGVTPKISPLTIQDKSESEMPRELIKSRQPIWTPKTKAKTYPVLCEECKQEVGRSLVENSTIICPGCRTNLRKSGPKVKKL